MLIGLLADASGFPLAFTVCGAIAFIGIIAWAFGRDPHAEVGNKPKRVPQEN